MGGKDAVIADLAGREDLNLWVHELDRAMRRAAHISAQAIKAGLEERQVRVAEQYGRTIIKLIDGVLGQLGLTVDQRALVPAAVRTQLAAITAA